jgi:hypothetical protein
LHASDVPSKRELRDTAEALRRIVDAVDRGELDAPPELAQRLDSAVRALEALARPSHPAAWKEHT